MFILYPEAPQPNPQAKTQKPSQNTPVSLWAAVHSKELHHACPQVAPEPHAASFSHASKQHPPRRRRPRIPSHNHNVNQQTQAACVRSRTRRVGARFLTQHRGSVNGFSETVKIRRQATA